ncbi:Hemolysin activation/secretion protein [Rubrivivax sp. A210]|nr:Hemolysin activation/secretion protein [Rubrivivax sp. A210]
MALAPLMPLMTPVPAAAQAQPAAATVEVNAYEIVGNTLLAPALIEARLQAHKGARTLAQLKDAAAAVQDLYRAAGYGGVVAFLPEQDPKAGVLRIRVVEGRLTRIDVEEGAHFKRANLLASLPALALNRTPEVRRIDAEIQMANENPAKTLQVLLQPGSEPGSIAAKLGVVEQPVRRVTARLDNTGGRQDSRLRAALGWQDADLLGGDEVFGVEWQTAPGDPAAVNVISASYRVPLYGRGLAIDAYGAWSDVDAGKIGTQAGDLQFSGRGTVAGLRANVYLPRQSNLDQRLVLGAEWREYRNSCSITGLPEGACGAAGASVSLQPLSLTYTAQTVSEQRLGFSLGLHGNLGSGGSHGRSTDFEAVRPGSRRHYLALRASAQLGLPFDSGAQFALRASGQASGRPLVPGEMFGIGGAYSVRGYEERELSGDSGLQLTAEALSPDYGVGAAWLRGGELRALFFGDAGWVGNRQDSACLAGHTRCNIAAAGLGLRLGWPGLQLRADLAVATRDAAITRRGDRRLHFAVNASY